MRKVNLLQVDPSAKRDLSLRSNITSQERAISSRFGRDYFDGDRRLGYGGYYYDGRWIAVARRAVKLFGLKAGDKVLDIGCGKGFFVYDLVNQFDIDACGLDISEYALEQARPEVQGRLHLHDIRKRLMFPDSSFDAVFCINTLHNLERGEAVKVVEEMIRVAKVKKNIFIQVDSYRNAADRDIFEKWVLTAKLYMLPDDWLKFLVGCGYAGSYFWTILRGDGSVE